jgi:ribosome biogenesis GTPase
MIEQYGFTPELLPEHAEGIPARITAVHKERFGVVSDYGEGYARLKAGEYYYNGEAFPTVGDFVLIDCVDGGDSRIIATLPRRTYFSRRDPDKGRGEQAVAANFDTVFIMQSMNQNFNVKRLERYLTAAEQSGAALVVVLTKADLADDPLPYILETSRVAPGVDLCIVSSRTGAGMDALQKYLIPGRTLVFLGSSGVGKSSLVNALAGRQIMDVGVIREEDSRGRHTTTHRELIMLDNGVMIIDTPGMRELGMWDVSQGLGEAFADIEGYAMQCRFRNCRHEGEPGCAVRQAIADGDLDPARLESYNKLKAEARFSDNKSAVLRQKEEKFKAIGKAVKKMEKDKKKKRDWF